MVHSQLGWNYILLRAGNPLVMTAPPGLIQAQAPHPLHILDERS